MYLTVWSSIIMMMDVSRERNFDEESVLDVIADVFVVHGYGGTSVAMLVEATGLGKQSIYNTFGDKQALYLRSVECAVMRLSKSLACLQQARDGREAVMMFFREIAQRCASANSSGKSCIVSAGLLEGLDDEGIRLALERKWNATHELLRGMVERGQRDHSIRNGASSVELADYLMSAMSGLRVNARVHEAAGRITATVALQLSILDRP